MKNILKTFLVSDLIGDLIGYFFWHYSKAGYTNTQQDLTVE
jgi:hypothetical protein